jgi:Fibronectin type III domain
VRTSTKIEATEEGMEDLEAGRRIRGRTESIKVKVSGIYKVEITNLLFSSPAVMIPPSSPNITRLSDESVMVRWDVISDEGLSIQFFKVQYKDLDRGRWNTIDEDIPPHIRSYEVDNLKPDHYYK